MNIHESLIIIFLIQVICATYVRHFIRGIDIMNKEVSYLSVQTMESMVKWLDNNVLENPTLEGMSSHVGYPPYYCSTKFREYTGITYKQYLAKCRLNAATNLLIMTDYKPLQPNY